MHKKVLFTALALATSAFASTAFARSTFENDYNFRGNDLRSSMVGARWDDCAAVCERDGDCRAWSYRKKDGKCWEKSGAGHKIVVDHDYVSGRIEHR